MNLLMISESLSHLSKLNNTYKQTLVNKTSKLQYFSRHIAGNYCASQHSLLSLQYVNSAFS